MIFASTSCVQGYAEGNRELCVSLTAAVPFLMKSILLNEYHFKRHSPSVVFLSAPFHVSSRNSESLLKKYMGEYRDLSTDCSVKQENAGYGIEEFDEENSRARFNWQERKRFDLKHRLRPAFRVPKPSFVKGSGMVTAICTATASLSPSRLS